MREHKYRAWHKEQMFEVTALQWSASNPSKFSKIEMISIDENHAITTVTSYDCDGCIIRQYTGLKDKNGQEIYEGDIIRAEEEGLGVIKYGVGCFYYEDDWNGRIALEELTDLMVVVGNVYEHPELLPQDDFAHKTNQQ